MSHTRNTIVQTNQDSIFLTWKRKKCLAGLQNIPAFSIMHQLQAESFMKQRIFFHIKCICVIVTWCNTAEKVPPCTALLNYRFLLHLKWKLSNWYTNVKSYSLRLVIVDFQKNGGVKLCFFVGYQTCFDLMVWPTSQSDWQNLLILLVLVLLVLLKSYFNKIKLPRGITWLNIYSEKFLTFGECFNLTQFPICEIFKFHTT